MMPKSFVAKYQIWYHTQKDHRQNKGKTDLRKQNRAEQSYQGDGSVKSGCIENRLEPPHLGPAQLANFRRTFLRTKLG